MSTMNVPGVPQCTAPSAPRGWGARPTASTSAAPVALDAIIAEETAIANSWTCSVCTFSNASAIALACSMCQSPRVEVAAAAPSDVGNDDDDDDAQAPPAAASEGSEYDTDRALAMLLQTEERDAYIDAQSASGNAKVVVRNRDPTWGGKSGEIVNQILHGGGVRRASASRASTSTDDLDVEHIFGLTLDSDITDVADDYIVQQRLRDGDPHVGKHDAVVWGRRHTGRIEEMAPASAGSMLSDGVVLPNKVYNALRTHYKKGFRKGVSTRGRVEAAQKATRGGTFDQRTAAALFGFTQAGKLSRVDGVLRSGKEASVHHAEGPPAPVPAPAPAPAPVPAPTPIPAPAVRVGGLLGALAAEVVQEIAVEEEPNPVAASPTPLPVQSRRTKTAPRAVSYAVKIFRTTVQEFRNRAEYMDGDHRFHRERVRTKDKFKLVKMWAEKEFANLHRIHRSGIRCPKPAFVKDNVLVMSWIGVPLHAAGAAPQLRDAQLSARRLRKAWLQVLACMRAMYFDARLVHGDLSEFNLLWFEKQLYVIDVGQAVDVTHPKAIEFLKRDCKNVRNWFAKEGLPAGLLIDVSEMVRIATTKAPRAPQDDEGAEGEGAVAAENTADSAEEQLPVKPIAHAEFVKLALLGEI